MVREHRLSTQPHVSLWLTKAFVIPAGIYASQIGGTPFLKSGSEFDSSLQVWHLSLLKGILSVKRSAPKWAVLRECGQEPVQFCWFSAAVNFYNTMVHTSDPFLRNILRADIQLSSTDYTKWSAELMSAYGGLSCGANFAGS
jgi:hypothetical protein